MRMGLRQPDGYTLRQHLQAGARGVPLDQVDPLLRRDGVPPQCTQLWRAFVDLGASRPAGMGGPCAIPQSELMAWQANHGVRLTSWELETLTAMDRAALAVLAEHAAKQRPARKH